MEFDEFWRTYPKKQGKGDAEKKYAKLTEAEKQLISDTLAERIKRDPKWETKQFVPMPATYLNQQRWHDEYDAKPMITSRIERPEIDTSCDHCRGDTRTQRHENICVHGHPYYDYVDATGPRAFGSM